MGDPCRWATLIDERQRIAVDRLGAPCVVRDGINEPLAPARLRPTEREQPDLPGHHESASRVVRVGQFGESVDEGAAADAPAQLTAHLLGDSRTWARQRRGRLTRVAHVVTTSRSER